MRIRRDGSVQSGAVPTYQNVSKNIDDHLYRGMVIEVIYTDNPINITSNSKSPRVLYNVVILGGNSSGQVLSNCRLSSELGGNSSYYERILKATSKNISKDRLSSNDGDIVYVRYIQGNSEYPVIVSLDQGNDTGSAIGAAKSEGPRLKRQYNGVAEEINKDGEWELARKGGSAQSEIGGFTPNSSKEITLKLTKDEQFSRVFKSGLSILEDGKADKVTMTTAAGASISIDGKNSKITIEKGSTLIEVDGNGDKISLKGGFIDLGSSVSDFVVLFTELLSAFNTHTHQFIDITPLGPVPSVTMPPVAPLLQSVGSSTVKVQS